MEFMEAQDAPALKLATVFVTIGNNRYPMMMARNFEANATIETAQVPILGKPIKGVKVTGMTIKFSMTIFKCTEVFDDVIDQYKSTGVMPTFDIQTSSEDPATSIGKSTKIYTDCVIDGDVLLSAFDSDGEFVEQTITGYAQDFSRPERYTNPSYM